MANTRAGLPVEPEPNGLRPKLTGSKPDSAAGFSRPVDWLLGRELLTYLRSMSLYSSNGSELDHRDWMHPEIVDLADTTALQNDAFWFDYMADTGDGQMAMYSLAYLALGDLWLDQGKVSLTAGAGDGEHLPRGSFLFLGGDTAYHVADRGTLVQRFSAPFDWAHQDRVKEGTLGGHAVGQADPILFAIPGNHDYYDSLLGFNHLFRYNTTPHDRRPLVADFARRQDASFVILRLPFGWWFWGLDTQNGRLDWRQKHYLLDHLEEHSPSRLIVCTPEPTTVFGRLCGGAIEPFKALNLPRPFTNGGLPAADQIHLDLAGDVHHYARHSLADTPNYASVVSGGGGAFLHSSHTKVPGKAVPVQGSAYSWPPEAKLYPEEEHSCRETNRRLLCPWKIATGGYVWAIGAVCAAIIYYGAAVAPHTRVLSTMIGQWLAPFSDQEDAKTQLNKPPNRELDAFQSVAPALLPLNVAPEDDDALDVVLPALPRNKRPIAEGLAAVLVLAALAAGFALSARAQRQARTTVVKLRAYVAPLGAVLAASMAVSFVYRYVGGVYELPAAHPFISSLMLLLFGLPLVAAWFWTSGYVPTLPKQAKLRRVTGFDYVPVWVAMGLGVGSIAFGLLVYGVQAIGHTVTDLLFVFAFAFMAVGPTGLGWAQAGHGRPVVARMGFALLGLYLGMLQISIPLLLALDGSWLRAAIVVTWTLLVTAAAAIWFTSVNRSRYIWLLWIVAGGGALVASVVEHTRHEISVTRLVVALFSTAALTCVWFGWYLASALAFGGHNNEAGGAAQLDRYRHFIRFKVQKDRLTGYVIGIARPSHEGQALTPVLVDVFELTPKQ